jgi:hypothetical protein
MLRNQSALVKARTHPPCGSRASLLALFPPKARQGCVRSKARNI